MEIEAKLNFEGMAMDYGPITFYNCNFFPFLYEIKWEERRNKQMYKKNTERKSED